MPLETIEPIGRIKVVEVEHTVARLALDRLMAGAIAAPSTLPVEWKTSDIRLASDHPAGTYLIHLFAEFETALRSFRPEARTTAPPSRTRDLSDGIASTCRVAPGPLANAHSVREYRNALVHEREAVILPIPVAEARGHLCKFPSHRPLDW